MFAPGVKMKLNELSKQVKKTVANQKLYAHKTPFYVNEECPTLKCLVDRAALLKEEERKNKTQPYDILIKNLSIKMFSLGGRAAYEYLTKNLPMPAISTIHKWIECNDILTEGEPDFDGLVNHLKQCEVPPTEWFVYGQEDGTAVVPRIEYREDTNEVVGFVKTINETSGFPTGTQFPATSPSDVHRYFQLKQKSNNMIVVMITPLHSNASPYCLTVFGTDNSFSHDVVRIR